MIAPPLDFVWQAGKFHEHIDQHTSVTPKKIGGGITISTNGIQAEFRGLMKSAYLHFSTPGMFSRYYCAEDGYMIVGERKWQVQRHAKDLGLRGVAKQAECGIIYRYDGVDMKEYRGDVWTPPPIEPEWRLPDAAKAFWDIWVAAAEDSWKTLGSPARVGLLLSAGTDSALTLLALRELGIEVVCFTSGRNWEDFDPYWSRQYTEQLGMDDPILVVTPTEDNELRLVLNRTIAETQISDFSNVLMACCNHLIRKEASALGLDALYCGYMGDSILGTNQETPGPHLKVCRELGVEPTAESWQKARSDYCMRTYPNTRQIAKVSRVAGMDWRAMFYDLNVINFVMAMPLEVCPVSTQKLLLWEVLKDRLTGSWDTGKKKIGFYTGAGIGKVRLANPILQDPNMRAVYQAQKALILGG